jgi:glycosyltransferase involved in cell wall biosynthesis
MTVQSIVYAFADSQQEWNTSEWRSRIGSDALNQSGRYVGRCIPLVDFSNYGHDAIQQICGAADVIVVQRNLLASDIWEACDYWRGLGKLVVADLDDDYPHLTPQNPAYKFWILDKSNLKERTGYTPIEALTEGFRHVDALISPNEHILSDWAEVLDLPGYWLPNYARWEWYEGIKQAPVPKGDAPIIIGWGGSVSHWDSWWFSGLREAIPVLTEKYPRITWKICGGDKRVKEFFDDIAPGRWVNQRGVTPDQWPGVLATFDIGLAPLCGPGYPQGERYDQRRSWLKAVEYLLAGVPWIGSDGIVYEKLDGQGGFVVENTPEAWQEGLERIITDLKGYKTTSKKLMPWARDNLSLIHVIDRYVDVFKQIMVDKHSGAGTRIPDVMYASDYYAQVDELGEVTITIPPGDDLERLQDYQNQTLHAVRFWCTQMGLDHNGVNVGRCLEYPLLQELNVRVFTAQEQAALGEEVAV